MIEDVRDPLPGGNPDAGGPAEAGREPVAEPGPAASGGVDAFAAETAAAETLPAAGAVDYKDRWLRAEAELQNFRRRAARDREEAVRAGEDRLLLELIGVLDDLERALAALSAAEAGAPWAQGVALTGQRLRDVLARAGVRPLESLGQPFRPDLHEALLEVDAPEGAAPGTVVQEILKGYVRGERALRAARVVVARAPGGA